MPSETLLVMCGDAKRRESFVSALSDAGWQGILSASSMSEAARLIRNSAEVCAIVDAELADIPGLKAADVLRNLCPHIKIIFTVPENTRDLEAQVRALDVFYYYISSADATLRSSEGTPCSAKPATQGEEESLRSTSRGELVAAVREAIGLPARSAPAKAGAPMRGGAQHAPKILIVDDDPDFHEVVRVILEPAGYSIVSAYSQQEGLAAARREKPDTILLDIVMQSSTDGFEFCREARRDPQIKHTPILGISALKEWTEQHYPAERDPDLFPVDGFLSKPVAPEQLFAELKRLMSAEV